ncbi:hypothetical protein [Phenylobacterium sp.]|uniref:hypothetical protein n=1 Tax=Phenylobacterium sp. TaxID=1871053 RepID=UPI003568CD13
MTNVSAPLKVKIRNFLRRTAIKELEKQGHQVERIPRAGKGSLRKITKDGVSQTVTIRTSQDTWIAFPRNANDTGWSTLEDADLVLAASLDEKGGRYANFHLMDADDIRARFDRARAARLRANHVMPAERGIWISLYNQEADEPVSMVGAGAGLKYPAFAKNIPVLLDHQMDSVATEGDGEDEPPVPPPALAPSAPDDGPLTIPEAKRRLALAFGVDPGAIKIIVEG